MQNNGFGPQPYATHKKFTIQNKRPKYNSVYETEENIGVNLYNPGFCKQF